MVTKLTYSKGSSYRFADGETAKQIATAGLEVGGLSLKNAGGGGAALFIYDASTAGNANPSNLAWVLDTGATGQDNQTFPHPQFFKHGMYIVLEQGEGTKAVFCLNRISSEV